MAKKADPPILDLLVACQMAGIMLLKTAGQLQERLNEDREAYETLCEGIDCAGNDVLKALAKYTSDVPPAKRRG